MADTEIPDILLLIHHRENAVFRLDTASCGR
jgi:hypothetical protein